MSELSTPGLYRDFRDEIPFTGIGTITKIWYFTTIHEGKKGTKEKEQKLEIRYNTITGFWQMILNGKKIQSSNDRFSPFSNIQLSFELGFNNVNILIDPSDEENNQFILTLDNNEIDDILASNNENINELLYPFDISILNVTKVLHDDKLTAFYRIKTLSPDGTISIVDRRYNEFSYLNDIIKSILPDYYISNHYPDFPLKSFDLFEDQLSISFLTQRKRGLEHFIRTISRIPKIRTIPDFLIFLGRHPITALPKIRLPDDTLNSPNNNNNKTLTRKDTLTAEEVSILTGELNNLRRKLSKLRNRRKRERERSEKLSRIDENMIDIPIKPVLEPELPMKSFFWNKLEYNNINETIFSDLNDRFDEIDWKLFQDSYGQNQFIVKNIEINDEEVKNEQNNNIIFDEEMIELINDGLTKIDLTPMQIRRAILAFDQTILTIEKLEILINITPNKISLDIIKQLYGTNTNHIERYLSSVQDIPNIKERLTSYLYILKFDEQLEEIYENLDIVLSSIQKIKESDNLKYILEVILAVGNFLNYNTERGSCYGYHIDTLQKLTKLKSNDHTYSLLDYLVTNLNLKNKNALNITKELDIVHQASNISLENLSDDINRLIYGLNQLEEHQDLLRNNHSHTLSNDQFLIYSRPFITKANQDLNGLQVDFKSTINDYHELLEYFGEEEKINTMTRKEYGNITSTEFFSIFSNFLRDMVSSILRGVNSF